MAKTVITKDDIKKINELYLKYKTYAAVSRELGISAGTVKKYVIPGYKPIDESNFIRFKKEDLPEKFSTEKFKGVENFGDLCVLSEDEIHEIEVLHGEMEI